MTVRQFTLAALIGALVATPSAAQDNAINLGLGTQRVISVPGASKVAVGNQDVADVKNVGPGQILVVGSGVGRTSLLIWKSNGTRVSYTINVRRQDPGEVIGEVRKLLGDMEGITVKSVGDRVIVDGQAYTSQDADRIEQIVTLYPNVTSFVRVAPNARKLTAQNLQAAFVKAGLKNVQPNVIGSTIFLEGSVESQQDLTKAELLVKAMGEKVENLLVVGIKRMVLSEVQFVEIRRASKDRYGIKYPTDITGQVLGNASFVGIFRPGNLAATAPTLVNSYSVGAEGRSDFSIGFQANDGYGRLLAQPKLVCASGEQAEFLAGGEVPIPLITNNQFTVEYKQYGIILKIKPTADRNGNIQTEIEAEASEVDETVKVSVGATSVPGFRTRKVKTNVTVRHGETIVLSGVFSHNEQKSVSKLPGVGHIPIVGELFKSRGFDADKRELVIFVTPRIVNPDTDRIQEYIEQVKNRYKQARGEVTFNIFD